MNSESKQAKKQDFWKEHSEAWKASELTQVAYCAQQGISYQSFTYQHKRMAMKSQRSTIGFVEAKPEANAVSHQTAGLQLMLPNGIRIGITNEVNPALLKTVLSIAGGMSC
jgi:hypothetical protein